MIPYDKYPKTFAEHTSYSHVPPPLEAYRARSVIHQAIDNMLFDDVIKLGKLIQDGNRTVFFKGE